MTKKSDMHNLINQLIAQGLMPAESARTAQELAESAADLKLYRLAMDGYDVTIVPVVDGTVEVDNLYIFRGFGEAKAAALLYLKDNLTMYRKSFKDLRSLKKSDMINFIEEVVEITAV